MTNSKSHKDKSMNISSTSYSKKILNCTIKSKEFMDKHIPHKILHIKVPKTISLIASVSNTKLSPVMVLNNPIKTLLWLKGPEWSISTLPPKRVNQMRFNQLSLALNFLPESLILTIINLTERPRTKTRVNSQLFIAFQM